MSSSGLLKRIFSRDSTTPKTRAAGAVGSDKVSEAEIAKISSQLDELAVQAPNPLLGVQTDDVDEDEDEDNVLSRSLGLVSVSDDGQRLAIRTASSLSESRETVGSSQGSLSESQESILSVEGVHDEVPLPTKETDTETLLELYRTQLEMATQATSHLEERLKQLVFERDLRPLDDRIQREMRKRREEIRELELKQWKITSAMEKLTLLEDTTELQELDAKGNLTKQYTVHSGKKVLVGATKEALVALIMTDTGSDIELLEDFLIAYRLIMPSRDLLNLLFKVYDTFETKSLVLPKLMSFLRKWVEWCWNNDFQMENLVQRFKELTLYGYASASDPRVPLLGQDSSAEDLAFLTSYLTQNNLTASERMIQAGRRVRRAWVDGAAREQKMLDEVDNKRKQAYASRTEDGATTQLFMQLSEDLMGMGLAFAEQELRLYQRIRPEEFIEKVVHPGSVDAPNVKCRHLVAMIGWANQIGYWLAVSVCITHDMKKRVKLLARFIELAGVCKQLGCFNTVFAIVTGLSNSLITRLKKTWDRLPKKTVILWGELELLCSPQVNYRAYRAVEAEAKPPFIPFIGMQLRDMVFMNDGNPVQLLNGLYNVPKLRSMARRSLSIISYQHRTMYPIPELEDPALMIGYFDAINTLKPFSDKHLHALSCMCEQPALKNSHAANDPKRAMMTL